MTTYTIRLLELANGQYDFAQGQYVVAYDPIANTVDTTRTQSHALPFPTVADALAFYRQNSGRPYPSDRPLTAWTIEIEPL